MRQNFRLRRPVPPGYRGYHFLFHRATSASPIVCVIDTGRYQERAFATTKSCDVLALEVAGVAKCFGQTTALDGVDLQVPTGTMHGLLGPNGAGKTTLLRALAGLIRPDSGTIAVFGDELVFGAGLPSEVAAVVDAPAFTPYLSARCTLQILTRLDGSTPDRAALDGVLDRVGLATRAGRRVEGWSTGMRLRLAIAAALLRRPRLLILDEPLSGLDASGARDVAALFVELVADGVTILVSSHDMDHVETCCDDVTILRAGTAVFTGSLGQLERAVPRPTRRLRTTDDAAAVLVAKSLELDAALDEGSVFVASSQEETDALVGELAGAGVVIRELATINTSLEARFLALTESRP
jgi:ABC-2 type transport system ATP-binding protein